MSSNILIAYPSIPFAASSTTLTLGSVSSGYSVQNLCNGGRSNYVELNGASDSGSYTLKVTYDLGSGVSYSSDYLIVARADLR